MASAICIITSTGMKCLSSPIKQHRPSGHTCQDLPANSGRDAKVRRVSRCLEGKSLGLSAGRQKAIAQVVELMLAANVGARTPFTIVRAG